MAIGDRVASKAPVIDPLSRSNGDFDSEVISSITECANYTVQLPLTPDFQPMGVEQSQPSPSLSTNRSARLERNVSNSMFTGGYNTATRALSKEKKIDSQTRHEPCSVPGCCCREVAGADDGGLELVHCSCGYRICKECFREAFVSGDGACPYCRRAYKRNGDVPDLSRSLSVAKTKNVLVKGQVYEFNSSEFLFGLKKDYEYGNASWPESDGDPEVLEAKEWRPLTRRVDISAIIITPYRLLVLFRIFALALFLLWRIRNPNEDAMWLWGMSVVCEIWFAFTWLLDQLPKLCPINRVADLNLLKEKFESPNEHNPKGKSDLPGLDIFVSTADPDKEPPLVTANTILSILAADYPVEKLSCYISDDGGSLLTFEAMAEAASFANLWVPFCRKHDIEPRNPESYFNLKRDPFKGKIRPDFVRDRRRIKREYDEFKVRINALSDSIRRRSDAYNIDEEIRAMKQWREENEDEPIQRSKISKATWMSDGTHWPGTWTVAAPQHSRGDHASVIQAMLQPPRDEPLTGTEGDGSLMDLIDVDIRLPMLVYVSREKRPGYDHNKKAGAMNALVRASAIMSNGAFILNLDCDHYIYNSKAPREGMCFMMDRDGHDICYVQFPQRFEGIDPSDRYANHNTVFFDVNMRALDGIQGPVYVGTGCLFRRIALYGYDPPQTEKQSSSCSLASKKSISLSPYESSPETKLSDLMDDEEIETSALLMPKVFGNSSLFSESIDVAAFEGMPLADHPAVRNGRAPGALIAPKKPLHPALIAEAVDVVSCFYEDKTQWGQSVGWIYGSVTEDVVTGYRMHERGWRSVYCVTKRDAFHGTAPINLTDRLHQVLRWATGSVEIFFSRNNAILAGSRLKFLQRIAYLNVGIYPFTSVFLIVYCFLPALCLFSNQFIVQSLKVNFLAYLLAITTTLLLLSVLEIKWSGITLEEWWRNEQFWLIGGTSAHFAAVLQGLLKVIAGIEVSFTLTSKSAGDDADDEFADLYLVKWTSLMVPPCTIMMVNLIAIAAGISRNIYAINPEWSKLLGGVFFSFWVLAHLYPFSRGLMGRQRKTPTIVYISAGLVSICISLLWVTINPPSGSTQIGGAFQLR